MERLPATHHLIGISGDRAASAGNRNKFDSTAFSPRSNTLASPIKAIDAHTGHRIELLPTESQSWHKQAAESGIYCLS
jgi:hypothetical protein